MRTNNGLLLPEYELPRGARPFMPAFGGAFQPVFTTPGFTPTQIAGLKLWLKADAGLFKDAAKAQPATADADAIYTWADQSGNGNDAIQATLANRPLLKLAIQNGKAVVRFDGADDGLQTAIFGSPLGQPN